MDLMMTWRHFRSEVSFQVYRLAGNVSRHALTCGFTTHFSLFITSSHVPSLSWYLLQASLHSSLSASRGPDPSYPRVPCKDARVSDLMFHFFATAIVILRFLIALSYLCLSRTFYLLTWTQPHAHHRH